MGTEGTDLFFNRWDLLWDLFFKHNDQNNLIKLI
jgi:hypothetical protein